MGIWDQHNFQGFFTNYKDYIMIIESTWDIFIEIIGELLTLWSIGNHTIHSSIVSSNVLTFFNCHFYLYVNIINQPAIYFYFNFFLSILLIKHFNCFPNFILFARSSNIILQLFFQTIHFLLS